MGRYGKAAIRAVDAYTSSETSSIAEAWDKAAREVFRTESLQKKSCPRSTFLGICEAGLVTGVPAGRYNFRKVSKNKQYGLNAIAVLRQQPALAEDPVALWVKIGNAALESNEQMDVIVTMWKQGLIKSEA